jgi:hypothetical protein
MLTIIGKVNATSALHKARAQPVSILCHDGDESVPELQPIEDMIMKLAAKLVARARTPESEASENVRASGPGRGGGRWRRVPAQRCPNGEMEISYESRKPHGDQCIVRLATNLIAVDFRSRLLACPLLGQV